MQIAGRPSREQIAVLSVTQALVLIKLPVEVAPWTFCKVDSKKLCKLELVDWLLELPCPAVRL